MDLLSENPVSVDTQNNEEQLEKVLLSKKVNNEEQVEKVPLPKNSKKVIIVKKKPIVKNSNNVEDEEYGLTEANQQENKFYDCAGGTTEIINQL